MSEFAFLPVSAERVEDLTGFCEKRGRFGNGKFAWCSCMRWRMPAGQFQASTPAGRTAALVDLVGAGVPVGVLGVEGYPVEPGPRSYTYMGSPAIFAAAGFGDVTPAGQRRRVVRLALARPRR